MKSLRYTYTYRDKSGMMKAGTICGSSRADAFASLKDMGISPMSLKTQESEEQSPRSRRKIIYIYILLILIIVGCILGGGVSLSYRGKTSSPSAPEKMATSSKPPSTQTHKAGPGMSTVLSQKQVGTPLTNTIAIQKWPLNEYRGQKVVDYSITTNANGAIQERYKTSDGNTHSIITDSPPVFENSSDQVLAMALSVQQGGELPPLPIPPTMEKDFLDSLSKPILINEDDSDAVKKLKEDVIAARKDMLELLKSGGSAAEVLQEHRRLLNENTATRNQVIKELRAIIDSGDIKGAEKYVRTMNVALGQMGIMEISMPRSAEARARRATTHKTVQDRNPENNQ